MKFNLLGLYKRANIIAQLFISSIAMFLLTLAYAAIPSPYTVSTVMYGLLQPGIVYILAANFGNAVNDRTSYKLARTDSKGFFVFAFLAFIVVAIIRHYNLTQ